MDIKFHSDEYVKNKREELNNSINNTFSLMIPFTFFILFFLSAVFKGIPFSQKIEDINKIENLNIILKINEIQEFISMFLVFSIISLIISIFYQSSLIIKQVKNHNELDKLEPIIKDDECISKNSEDEVRVERLNRVLNETENEELKKHILMLFNKKEGIVKYDIDNVLEYNREIEFKNNITNVRKEFTKE